ncbi:AlpA family phage regulatory protein [Thiothrix lacustris]|uniref:AlpA family phage regulatory protein n=1 Tax=Thiothrix lacustris TaxID=525917 RepID=A0ABY9MQD7_9GAMM|nr:AlpA family phage regulatory protein [Thiothrix lacustris]WML90865.1 AlpA family phage regulatory protein [Thiothrix lacustris]
MTQSNQSINITYRGEPIAHIPQATDRAIRMEELKRLIGLSKTTIYEMIKNGEFDPGFLIGKRARGWYLSTAISWLESRKQGGVV